MEADLPWESRERRMGLQASPQTATMSQEQERKRCSRLPKGRTKEVQFDQGHRGVLEST